VQLHQPDRAEEHFKRAIELGTTIYPSLNLADLYVKQNRFVDSRNGLNVALRSNREAGDLYYGLANTYLAEGRLEEAKAAALEGAARGHRIPDLHLLLAKLYAGYNNEPAMLEELRKYVKEARRTPLRERIRWFLRTANVRP
jgi:predicted Zn-dependent protease